MAFYRSGGGSDGEISCSVVDSQTRLQSNATKNVTIDPLKVYLVFANLQYSNGYRASTYEVKNGAVNTLVSGTSSSTVTVNGDTLTLKGTNTNGIYTEFTTILVE